MGPHTTVKKKVSENDRFCCQTSWVIKYVSVHTTQAQQYVRVPEFFVVSPLPEPNCGADTSEQFIVEGDHGVGCTLNLPLSHLQGKEGGFVE